MFVHINTVIAAMSCMIKIHLKAEDESEQRQNTSHHARFSELWVKEGIMASVWEAVWGVVLCAQALGAPVAGWTRASAERMTPAIPVEFGLYS